MAQLLDCFPLLQHVPETFMPIKKRARNMHKKELELYLGHWMSTKEKIKNGTVNVSQSEIIHILGKLTHTRRSLVSASILQIRRTAKDFQTTLPVI
jgi:hypothetical protein